MKHDRDIQFQFSGDRPPLPGAFKVFSGLPADGKRGSRVYLGDVCSADRPRRTPTRKGIWLYTMDLS